MYRKTTEIKVKSILFGCILCMIILISTGAGLLSTLKEKSKNPSYWDSTQTDQHTHTLKQINTLYIFIMFLICIYIISLFILSASFIQFEAAMLFLAICLSVMIISFLCVYRRMNIYINKKGQFTPHQDTSLYLTPQGLKRLRDTYMCLLIPFWSILFYICIVTLYFIPALIRQLRLFSL
jgi:Ca2+/Na+ antiporter